MNKRFYLLFSLLVISSMLLSACGAGGGLLGGSQVVVSMYYGSEKEEWLVPLVEEFNQAKNKTESGATIVIEAVPMGSIESMRRIVSQDIQPTVWSPASDIVIPLANAAWRAEHSTDLVDENFNYLVLSPVIIAMWQPMAEALGWPEAQLGWQDISQLAISDEGWAAYGYPEWGSFKFGHTHPNFSNSGLVSVIAQAYAGADKQRGLTTQDLSTAELQEFMQDVQSSIIHYGKSTGFFATRMFERGPSYLSAAVMYENLVVAQETKRLSGASSQPAVVAIYPKEGTFWSNHPYTILNAPWVTDEQREAAQIFEDFLLDPQQQEEAIQYGFRPADPSIGLSSPLDPNHGVDTNQPQTVLEVPPADVTSGIQDLWAEVKKPVDVVVVMDTSGSMQGKKIAAARDSLIEFVDLLDDRDRMQVVLFNTDIFSMTEMTPVGEKREDLKRRISGVIESGGTRLYDATLEGYQAVEAQGDPGHIRAVVVLSDGMDTDSQLRLEELTAQIGATGEESGTSIKVFTIAFGNDADESVLRQIAEITGGKQYKGDPDSIHEIYAEIETFF
jgi:Ca-activated chloride channel family protein